MASPKFVFAQVAAPQGRIVRSPGLDYVVRASDCPAVPENHVAEGLADSAFIGRKKGVSDAFVEQENEIKAAPAEVVAAWTACSTRPVNDASEPSITPDDVA